MWGWVKADEEQRFSRQQSATHGFSRLSLCTDEKCFENPREMFGDRLHSLPRKRGRISPNHQLTSISVCVSKDKALDGFGKNQRFIWATGVSEGS